MKLFTVRVLCCYILLSHQMALAALRARMRERWRLQLRMRIGPETPARTNISDAAFSASTVKELPSSLKTSQPMDNSTAPTAVGSPTIQVSLRRAPPGFVDSPDWDYESASRLLRLIEADESSLHKELMHHLGSRRQFYYSEEYNARRPDGDELKNDTLVEVSNAIAARLPTSRISVKRLKRLLVLRAQLDRGISTTTKPTFSWKKQFERHRTTTRTYFHSRHYNTYHRRSQSKELNTTDFNEEPNGRNQTNDLGDFRDANRGFELSDGKQHICNGTTFDGNHHSSDPTFDGKHHSNDPNFDGKHHSNDTNIDGKHHSNDPTFDDKHHQFNETELRHIFNKAKLNDDLGDNLAQNEVGDKDYRGLDHRLDYRRNLNGTLDDRINQTEILDDAPEDHLDHYEAGDKFNQGDSLDEELNEMKNQGNEEKVLEESGNNQGNAIDEAPSEMKNHGNEDKVLENIQNQGTPDEISDKPSDEIGNKLSMGDIMDKAVYEALIDRRQGDGLDKVLKVALGYKGNPGEDIDKALDKAINDGDSPSDALDRALHETISIGGNRNNQGEMLENAIDEALADGRHIEEDFKDNDDLPAEHDYRRAFDADEVDATQLYKELSINDTNDDVIKEFIAAAMEADSDHMELNSIPSLHIFNSVATVSELPDVMSITVKTVESSNKNSSTKVDTKLVPDYSEYPIIAFYNRSLNSNDGVYVDDDDSLKTLS